VGFPNVVALQEAQNEFAVFFVKNYWSIYVPAHIKAGGVGEPTKGEQNYA
jgi:hypothetical protein